MIGATDTGSIGIGTVVNGAGTTANRGIIMTIVRGTDTTTGVRWSSAGRFTWSVPRR
jgi:hypothetical protein